MFSTTEPANKRTKLSEATAASPTHSFLENETITFHFANAEAARDYLSQININLALNDQPVVDDTIAQSTCGDALDHESCAELKLTKNQVDAWLGTYMKENRLFAGVSFSAVSTFKLLNSIPFKDLPIEDCDKLNELLSELPAVICNDLALMKLDADLPLITRIPLYKALRVFKTLLNKISDDTLNKAALICGTCGDSLLMHVAQYLNPEIFNNVLDRLASDIINQSALLQYKDGYSVIQAVIIFQDRWDHQTALNYIQRLSNQTCNYAALLVDRELMRSVFMDVAESKNRELFAAFINKLSQETCRSAITRDMNVGSKLASLIVIHQDPKVVRSFFDKLDIATCAELGKKLAERQSNGTGTELLLRIQNKLMQDPVRLKDFNDKHPQLKGISIRDGGFSSDSWSPVTEKVIDLSPSIKPRRPRSNLSDKLSADKAIYASKKPDYFDALAKEGWSHLRIQGRTILFTNSANHILAVKVKKQKEDREELIKEFNTTNYLRLNKDKLGLQSEFPTPISITKIPDVLAWLSRTNPNPESLAQFREMVGAAKTYDAYVYQVDPSQCDYFTYLHDARLSDEAFNTANHRAIYDLYTLFMNGVVFPQLGDIFHNLELHWRADGGRYMVLVNILRGSPYGSGRLTGWKEAVAYPNIRASGLADVGDRISINDLIGNSDIVNKYYSETRRLRNEKTGNFLLANTMAEYQYIFFLIAGRRACDLTVRAKEAGTSPDDIKQIWYKAARQVFDNCVLAATILTHKSDNEVRSFLLANIDIERLARQMQYWMTDAYINDLQNNKIPDDIYGHGVEVDININAFRSGTFNSELGCSIDGMHQDLGPVNGQEPIKEANKLFYWLVTYVFSIYLQHQRAIKDINRLTNEKDLQKSIDLQSKSFAYLGDEEFHLLQMKLCKERLKQRSPALNVELFEKAVEEHRTKWVANATASNFWRKKILQKHEEKPADDKMDVCVRP